MTTWNHRVFRKVVHDKDGNECIVWSIREAFYDEDNRVVSWTTGIAPESYDEEGVEGLRQELLLMLKACDQPVLEDTDDGL